MTMLVLTTVFLLLISGAHSFQRGRQRIVSYPSISPSFSSGRFSVRVGTRLLSASSRAGSSPFEIARNLFNSIFKDLRVYPSYYDETYRNESLHRAGDMTCIINDPDITMRHKMIDFNATEEAKLIECIARERQSSRKPFFCLMSGRGTGKTRTLCELHSELLKEEYHCLSLAITFNHNWLDQPFFEDSDLEKVETKTKVALEVISRMGSVLYGEKLSTIERKLKARGVMSKLKKTLSEDLFKAFLEHAVARVRLTGKRVDYVVVHIDESTRLAEGMKGDFFSCVRSGILDTIFDGNFTAELVQSSLEAAPIGLTRSGRAVISIKKPTVLSIVPLIIDWLEIKDTPSSRLFLSLLNRHARTVEFFQRYVLKSDSTPEKGLSVISKENFRSRFSDLTEALATHYDRAVKVLSDDIFATVVLGEEVLLTGEVEELIMDSVFTNIVTSPRLDKTTFLPETNIFMLYISLLTIAGKKSPMKLQFMRTIDTTIELLAGVGDNNIGIILENFYLQHLFLRLHCAYCRSSDVSLAKLLGLDGINLSTLPCRSIMEAIIPPCDYDDISETMNAAIPSLNAKNKSAFKDFVASIPDALQVGLWKAAEGDSYDTLLMVRCPDEKPFFVFIENKSPSIKMEPGEVASDAVRKYLGDYRQYNVTRDCLIGIVEPENYVYTYFLADDEVRSRYDKERGCLIVGGVEASRFFGFFYDFYRALRALVKDPIYHVQTPDRELAPKQRRLLRRSREIKKYGRT